VPNGLYIQGLGRNTGEVYGVFADFKPKKGLVGIDYRKNSADFAGLQTLEEKIVALKPPKWPSGIWPINGELLARGKELYDANCSNCHGITNSAEVLGAWMTPIKAVGTDPKMADNAERMSASGLLAGSLMPPPPLGATLANPAKTHDILANAVVGSLFDEAFRIPITPDKIAHSGVWIAVRKDIDRLFPGENIVNLFKTKLTLAKAIEIQAFVAARLRGKVLERFNDMFRKPASADPGAAYESRVLSGIWATAPYLHNGSVPNLWELLTPAKQRKGTFMVGSRTFDPQKVGYDTGHSPAKNATFVADLANANGNGNGGHEYGTDLSEADRWAIIEYMKTM
jgi:mono/diheme cytochrome c family protein